LGCPAGDGVLEWQAVGEVGWYGTVYLGVSCRMHPVKLSELRVITQPDTVYEPPLNTHCKVHTGPDGR
jgi:hypothetical protein